MATLQSRLLDLVAGLPTLRALRRVGGSATRIAELGAAHRRSTMATLRIAFLSSLVLELLATLGVALVAVSVGLRLVYGEMTLTAGLTALLLAPEVFWPLRRVGAAFHAAQDGKAAADNAFRLVDALPQPPDGTREVTAAGATIDITAFDAAAEPGRVTVIAGPNGAGKTTLLQADSRPRRTRIRPDTDRRHRRGRSGPALHGGHRSPGWRIAPPSFPARCCRISNFSDSLDDVETACRMRMFRPSAGRPTGWAGHDAGKRRGRSLARSATATGAGPGARIGRSRAASRRADGSPRCARPNTGSFKPSLRARPPARR